MSAPRVTCDYCLGSIPGDGLAGRAWPDRPAARYCCFGCLSLGEQRPVLVPLSLRFNGLALRIGLALVVIDQSMILSLGIALEDDASRHEKLWVYGGILVGTLIVFALLGIPLVRAACAELRAGFVTMESLFLLTMGGAFAASVQSFVTGSGPVYFEVVSVILVVYSVGKTITARAKQSAVGGTRAWADSLAICRQVVQGKVRETPVTDIGPHDVVEVRPGELIPVDGVIETGTGFVAAAAMTGEPFATVKRPGNPVLAGCVSQDALFRIRATVAGTARQVDHLLSAVEAARLRPTAGQAMVNRISARVFPLLLLTAVGTFAYWTWAVDASTGLFNAMSVLLVACPCALGLTTPLVIWITLARLAEWGFVVRAGDVVERLATIDIVIFDKTGTLTEDRFSLADIATADDSDCRYLGWIAATQARSPHPMGRAFAELAKEHIEVKEVLTVPGQGIEAVVEDEGPHRVRIGRPEWINALEDEAADLLARLIDGKGHRVDCEIDGRLAAVAVLRERLRESVPDACEHLAELGVSVAVLTGDTAERASITGVSDVQAGLSPNDKTARVRELRSAGRQVLMVGDGINDAGALSAANVGIALSSGTDLAAQAADVTLYHSDLRVIPYAIALGRRAGRVIRRNLRVAAAYNAIGVTLAVTGLLHPVIAALLMVGSSLFVIWSSSRVNAPTGRDCHVRQTPDRVPWSVTLSHALAVILQGVILIALLNLDQPTALIILVGFTMIGIVSASWWAARERLPHQADMAYGMLTLGNLGMIAGWWADAGFRPLQEGNCDCAEAIFNGVLKPWMWVGMWIGGTLAMTVLGRTPHGSRLHQWSMHTGGNLGMGFGMLTGGWLAAQVPAERIQAAAGISLAGMMAGMIVGMFAGTALVEQSARKWLRIRRKLRANR